MKVHVIWLDSGPEHYLCGDDCQLCVSGDKSQTYVAGRIYLLDEDMGATLLLPLFDTTKTKSIAAVKELNALSEQLGADILRTPLDLSLDVARTGVRHVCIETDKLSGGKIVTYRANDPECVAAQTLREKLRIC